MLELLTRIDYMGYKTKNRVEPIVKTPILKQEDNTNKNKSKGVNVDIYT
jgi:hypothetical protein